MTSAAGAGVFGCPLQSMVTVPLWRGLELSNSVTVVLDGDVTPLTTMAVPCDMLVCGCRVGDVELVLEVMTAE
jgi:hypothetical protein